jgi:hypothetical protein
MSAWTEVPLAAAMIFICRHTSSGTRVDVTLTLAAPPRPPPFFRVFFMDRSLHVYKRTTERWIVRPACRPEKPRLFPLRALPGAPFCAEPYGLRGFEDS